MTTAGLRISFRVALSMCAPLDDPRPILKCNANDGADPASQAHDGVNRPAGGEIPHVLTGGDCHA